MRRWMTALLVLCLLAGCLTFSASAAEEKTSRWQSVEEFEQHALAYWARPVHGSLQPVTGGGAFGGERGGGRLHAAIDLLRPLSMGTGEGTPIYAMASGTVINYLPYYYGATDAVAIQHADGSIARYCEISTPLRVGDTVEQGQQIGEMIFGPGNLCMLHLELFLGTSASEGSIGAASKSPDGSSGEYYKYVSNANGSYSRRSDLLDPTFLLSLSREIEPHAHDWGKTGLCGLCGCYKDPIDANAPVRTGAYLVKGRTALRAYPYAVCPADKTLAAGKSVTVTGAVVNALGETWYRCLYSGKTVYIEPAGLEKTGGLLEMPFTDVPSSEYYYDPILWAVSEGIASGVTDTEFAPEENCPRAQVVTFLWHAAGSPEPVSTDNPFDDVSPDSDYLKAVLWALETGVTSGTSETTFEPDAEVTRGQAVTFLWRAKNWPEPVERNNPFGDVTSDDYYYTPVLWAVENSVTSGTSETTFSPDEPCTRGQIVTFLYRCVCGT